jgi:outer membrane protein assembly factor BamB
MTKPWGIPRNVFFIFTLSLSVFRGHSEREHRVIVSRKSFEDDRTLILVSLDGAITALSPKNGKKMVRQDALLWSSEKRVDNPTILREYQRALIWAHFGSWLVLFALLQWTTRFGGPMIGSYSNAPVASSVDGASTQAPPLIVPGRDGSIMLASSGLQQLPYRAQDLVASAPWSLGQRGTSMMVGSKTSFMVEVDLRTGHVLQTLPTITDGCPTSPVPPSDGSAPPSMWLGRNDYVVRAYDTSARKLLWNLTYSEVMPPALPSDAQDAEQRADNAANAYLEQCEARQGRNIFSATVHGEITASDAITGALKWRSESLGAPLAHVYDVCSADSGETSYIEHRLLEVWPASAEFQQQLLNGGGASIAGGGGGDDGGSKAQRSEVFVGALPGGQLYVLPRSPYTTFDFTSPPEAFVSGGGGGGALLPAPVYDAATLAAAAKDVVVVHADDGVVSDSLITAHWLEQCGALWDLTRDPQVEYQCLIGVHNVTAAVDSHALRALPAAAALISGIAISSAAGSEGSRSTEPFVAASILSPMARQIASSIAPVGLVPHIAALLELVIAAMTVVAALLLVFSIVARVPCCRRAAQRAVSAVLGNWKRGGRTNRSRGRGGRASANDASGSTGMQPTLTIGVAAASDASGATATDAVAGSSSIAVVSAPRSMHSEATVQLGGVVHRVIGRLAISDRILGYGCNGTVVYAGQVGARSSCSRHPRSFDHDSPRAWIPPLLGGLEARRHQANVAHVPSNCDARDFAAHPH